VFNGKSLPAVTASASRDKKGTIHVTFTQADPHNTVEINLDIRGLKTGSVKGRILTAKELNGHNSFENPEVVKTVDFTSAKLNNNRLTVKLPPASVVMLELN
jgi:alpha-N-arabinofuranosidase